ncbi:tRNA intron endonuclease [Globomyces pollinis-pini]|nr:tRNA intron endonuclease [Globomyces pollinis-pini]
MESLIKIFKHKSSDYGLIWYQNDADNITKLRIVGSLIGCKNKNPSDETSILPIQLLPEEVTLLVELNLATIVQCHTNQPTSIELENYYQLQDLEWQQFEESKRIYGTQMKEIYTKNNSKEDKPSKPMLPIAIETVSNRLSWVETVPIDWKWPMLQSDIERYNIFKSLWNRGYYLTDGSKFGADYLLYSSHPNNCHSSYMVTIMTKDEELSVLDFISLSRLGTSVNKIRLFCSWSDEVGLQCVSSEWTGWV